MTGSNTSGVEEKLVTGKTKTKFTHLITEPRRSRRPDCVRLLIALPQDLSGASMWGVWDMPYLTRFFAYNSLLLYGVVVD